MNRNGVLLRSGSDGDRTRTQFADIGIRSNLHLHRNACCSAGRADFSPFQAGLHEFPRPVAFDREGDLRHIRSCNGELLFDSRNTQFVGFGRNPVVSGTGPEEYRCKNRKQSGEKVKFEGVHNALNCRFRLLFRAKIKMRHRQACARVPESRPRSPPGLPKGPHAYAFIGGTTPSGAGFSLIPRTYTPTPRPTAPERKDKILTRADKNKPRGIPFFVRSSKQPESRRSPVLRYTVRHRKITTSAYHLYPKKSLHLL